MDSQDDFRVVKNSSDLVDVVETLRRSRRKHPRVRTPLEDLYQDTFVVLLKQFERIDGQSFYDVRKFANTILTRLIINDRRRATAYGRPTRPNVPAAESGRSKGGPRATWKTAMRTPVQLGDQQVSGGSDVLDGLVNGESNRARWKAIEKAAGSSRTRRRIVNFMLLYLRVTGSLPSCAEIGRTLWPKSSRSRKKAQEMLAKIILNAVAILDNE